MALAVAALGATAFVGREVPVLRHDWPPPTSNVLVALETLCGWNPVGFGAPVGYPSSFMAVPLRAAMAQLLGANAANVVFFAAINLLACFGAARLARVLGASRAMQFACALFATFNPWVYTQTVAGHLFMMPAYAGTLWLAADTIEGRPNQTRLVALAAVIAPQIQFLVLDSLWFAYLAVRFRAYRAFAALAFLALPVMVGVALTRSSLLGIPLNLSWENDLSLHPNDAIAFAGYFTGYDAQLQPHVRWASLAFAIAAVAGLALARGSKRTPVALLMTGIAVTSVAWAAGTIGPTSAVFSWVILHIAESGLFRELYDVLGFLAVAYVGLAAIAAARFPPLGVLMCIPALAFPIGWIFAPPSRYWVSYDALPSVRVDAPPNSRFLLLPALPPLATAAGRGSGVDPDLEPHQSNVNPLDQFEVTYPLSSALGRFLESGSVDGFRALGVTTVIDRPWLSTTRTVAWQLALPMPSWVATRRRAPTRIDDAAPELGVAPMPTVATVGSTVGSGNVLFGDARGIRGRGVPDSWASLPPVRPVLASRRFLRAADGWVDARLAFIERPELGQSYGGALTTSASAILPIAGGIDALVWVRGRLLGQNGGSLSGSTAGYRWVTIPKDVEGLRCAGMCLVAAQADEPHAEADPQPHPASPLPFVAPFPWLALATVPANQLPFLRYNVAYDRLWWAYAGGIPLPHVRVDGVSNGYVMPSRNKPAHVVIVEVGALAITCAEVVALFGFIAMLIAPAASRLWLRGKRLERSQPSASI